MLKRLFSGSNHRLLKFVTSSKSFSLNRRSDSVPAQHGVGLSREDGRIHHESGVVHDQRDAFSWPDGSSMLFAAHVIHVHQLAQPLDHRAGVEVQSRRTYGPGRIASSYVVVVLRNPGGTWAGGSGGGASIAAFTVCVSRAGSNMRRVSQKDFSVSSDFLTVLSRWGGDISDAGCEPALSSLMGGVT